MNYTRFLTSLSKQRKPSAIRELTNLLASATPELVFLAGGLPNPNLFPFQEASFVLRDGSTIHLDKTLMATALQYGPSQGYPPLVTWLKSLTKRLHSPPLWEETDVLITNGSQDGLSKAVEMLTVPNDYFIIQEPCYPGTLAMLNPFSPKYIPVECDDKGMITKSLKSALSSWSSQEIKTMDDGVPKVMYVNPNAANPSGVSFTKERKKEIYKLACEYNLIILEDDPYYFVQFNELENLAPSFLSLDVDGRVLRFDSFSKVLSSGIRLGFVTGPKTLIRSILLHMQVSVLHASSLSQVMANTLLNKWGEEGFLQHTVKVQTFYKKQRDAMVAAAEKHLADLCEWSVPAGGMFLWIKVCGVADTFEMIMEKGLKKNVVLVPGRAFMSNPKEPSNYLRASFSLATPEKMELGMKYLAELIREELASNKNV